MTVKELREFLATVPDDFTVLVGYEGVNADAEGVKFGLDYLGPWMWGERPPDLRDQYERTVVVWAP